MSNDLVLLLAVGMVTGFSSGLFGIGGSLIGTPLLRVVVQMPPLFALATPLPVVIPSALSGAATYWRQGLVNRALVIETLRIALPATIVGSLLTHWTSGTLLMAATAGVLLYVAATMLHPNRKAQSATYRNASFRVSAASAAAGFIAGFLAIGGGVVLVPVFVRWFGLPIHQALATSLVCVAAMAIPGTIVHGILGHIDWRAAVILAVATLPTAALGARTALALKSRVLERAYGVLLSVFGIWFLIRTLSSQ